MHAFKNGDQWVAFTNQWLPIADFEPAVDPETNEEVEGQVNAFWVPAQWSDAEKMERFGLHRVTEPPIPGGKVVVSSSLVDEDGLPTLAYVLADVPAPTVESYTGAIKSLLNAAAIERQYDNAMSLTSYVNSTNAAWAAEAAAFVAWRDAVWAYANAELAGVQSGARPQPTVEKFLAELPELVWP